MCAVSCRVVSCNIVELDVTRLIAITDGGAEGRKERLGGRFVVHARITTHIINYI